MKVSIFDREQDDLLREDGEVMKFHNQSEAVQYLKGCEFSDQWIKENFVIMNRCKPLIPEVVPEFDESIKGMSKESKDKVDTLLSKQMSKEECLRTVTNWEGSGTNCTVTLSPYRIMQAMELYASQHDGKVTVETQQGGFNNGDLVFCNSKKQQTQATFFIYNSQIDYTNYYNPPFYKVTEPSLLNAIKELIAQQHQPEDYQQKYSESLEWIVMLQGVLTELVELKRIKDTDGKTPEYEERQPKAWYSAFQAIDLLKKDDGFYNKLPSHQSDAVDDEFVLEAMDAYWRQLCKQLESEDLGTIEKKKLSMLRDKAYAFIKSKQ